MSLRPRVDHRRGASTTACVAAAICFAASAGAYAADGKLLGEDYGRLRREALQLFPRGKPVGEVAEELKALGFKCAPTKRVLANVSAPTIECDSAGRGYPTTPRIEVTLIARNGGLADIAIGNGLDGGQADARTPDGAPRIGETAEVAAQEGATPAAAEPSASAKE